MYRVYVIQNPAGKFYIGVSENVEKRVSQHNDGVSTWTRGKGPWVLKWTSETLPLAKARKLVDFLKRQKGENGFFRARAFLLNEGGGFRGSIALRKLSRNGTASIYSSFFRPPNRSMILLVAFSFSVSTMPSFAASSMTF